MIKGVTAILVIGIVIGCAGGKKQQPIAQSQPDCPPTQTVQVDMSVLTSREHYVPSSPERTRAMAAADSVIQVQRCRAEKK